MVAEFWKGPFGDEYAGRAPGSVEASEEMLRRALEGDNIQSAIEFGAGVGTNLRALRAIYPDIRLAAVEVNQAAIAQMPKGIDVYEGDMLTLHLDRNWELAFTRGVLIHISPADLPRAYAKIYRAASRFVLLAEYYSPTREEVRYRGHAGKLWKGDFAGEMMDTYPDLRLLEYGFIYHRDVDHPQDDVTFFLMEKRP